MENQGVDISPVSLTKMQKLIKAEMYGRRQLKVLNVKLDDLDKRLKVCKEKGPKSHNYVLKQRKKVTENVRNMYGIYVRRKMMAVARMIITNFSHSIFGTRRNSTSDLQMNGNVENQEVSENVDLLHDTRNESEMSVSLLDQTNSDNDPHTFSNIQDSQTLHQDLQVAQNSLQLIHTDSSTQNDSAIVEGTGRS